MDVFLDEWYGVLAFVLFDCIALVAVAAITYRWLFKRVLDVLVSGVCLILLSPVFLVKYLRRRSAKKRGELETIVIKRSVVGKKGKIVRLRAFAGLNGKAAKSGVFMFADVFSGRLSFIGHQPFRPSDAEFLDEDEEERHTIRGGLINPLVLNGTEETTYDDMIASDRRYARTFGLGKDVKIFFSWLLKRIRGEGKGYLGTTQAQSYAETLLREDRITEEDFKAALEKNAE